MRAATAREPATRVAILEEGPNRAGAAMRVLLIATVAGLLIPAMEQPVAACGLFQSCGRDVVVFPATTTEGLPIGSVAARIRRQPTLDISRTTGRPLTILYNDPTREPGAVDPDVFLMPLPRARPSRTEAVYPVGY